MAARERAGGVRARGARNDPIDLQQRWRVRKRNRKESEETRPLLDARERMHALDAMRHWRDPTEREVTEFRTLRHHWDVLIDDNPCSG
jgi:hypothetical protein